MTDNAIALAGARVGTMAAPRVQGWCPGALRPMMSGDGLVLRLRPRLARFTRDQILGICAAARRHGAGLVDLTSRANLQVRGVPEAAWPALLDAFGELGLLDADARLEGRRNLLVAPDWVAGDDTERLAIELAGRLDELPDLPAKVGFVIDAGDAPRLLGDPGDFRIERGEQGGLILRAAGRVQGVEVTADAAVDALIALAHWFAASGGAAAGRMVRHRAPLPAWACGALLPAAAAARLAPGAHPLGWVCSLPFGQADAAALADAVVASGAKAVRITPWRQLLLEAARSGVSHKLDSACTDSDALAAAGWQVEACAGAPYCVQAGVNTRALALRLAAAAAQGGLSLPAALADAPRLIHVSGCAKGCAHAGPAAICLTGRGTAFDLAFDARPGEPVHAAELSPAAVLERLGVH